MGDENTNRGQIILTAIEGSSTDFPGVEPATPEELADSAAELIERWSEAADEASKATG